MTTAEAVTEWGIIMQAESIRAILDGRKSQTRRVVKPQPEGKLPICITNRRKLMLSGEVVENIHCPYGLPGDRLWVKEAYRLPVGHDKSTPSEYVQQLSAYVKPICYEADSEAHFQLGYVPGWGRYRHARFMPRVLSRLVLDVVDVRVERLQNITAESAESEGIDLGWPFERSVTYYADWKEETINRFRELWDSINQSRGFGWETNPFVWVVEFKPVEAP